MPAGSQNASAYPGGLTAAEAAARLRAEGFNELPQTRSRSILRLITDVLKEPMLALLVAGAVIYLLLGDLAEAVMLGVFASASIVITIVQEARTERVLESLRDLSSPRALVVRDGEQVRIAGREVVRGDLIVLTEGDRVAADAVLRQCDDLLTDESLLTGESVAVRKRAAAGTETVAAYAAGGDDQPLVFSSSLVVRGTGLAEVTATGPHTAIGRIGQAVTAVETETPRLQQQTTRLVTAFAIGGGIVVAITVVLYAVYRGGWLDGVLAGIALGMSMLPEEFPLVLTVFMAMGAWRISQVRVLTRRASAIESLGAATVLCTDKTGTLTQNRMTVARLVLPDGAMLRPAAASADAVTPPFHELVATAVLACDPQSHDPMERALQAIGAETGAALLRRYGLRPDLLAMTNVWSGRDGSGVVVAAKGAPEAIAGLCGITGSALAALQAQVETLAADGLRVLGIARAAWDDAELPNAQQDFAFTFCGLAGFADPLRAEVPGAVAECRSAGIRIIMITGDYPATATTIARQAGLDPERVITGPELAKLDDAALAQATRTPTAFARIMPEQKLRIVNALKADGEIVAMTGDGVNDAPSLKSAHIGIAMGGRGTDVAREASAIVLLDDDFGSIVKAIRLGRRIYDNLRKAMCFILAVHFPIAGLALLPLVTGLPLLLGPVHIAFLEMIIDPVCSLVFEAEIEEHDVMQRPPRDPQEPLLPRTLVLWGAFQGVLALLTTGGILLMASRVGMPDDEIRALVFFALVFVIVSLVFVNRSFSSSLRDAFTRPNRVLLLVIAIVVAVLATSLAWPVAAALFRFGPLHADDLALTVGAGIATLIVLELAKLPLRAAFTRRAGTSDQAKPDQVKASAPAR
ncbi:cation-translocating P-type ATPase [Bradyrhizobium ontarionense]|uniref:Cation-translocating P-type ATPase n=1 Tax=Bradyrhizobium ontarionense TaxID=2898149 RepID=A0ABY3R679_9BRAD|nr:cation-translocating P-type ATPase [Bradyrhizobium sp. A19]UFZ02830.1 cation-translocating P-type ATPase [Bradyrhizobium sp. A19]